MTHTLEVCEGENNARHLKNPSPGVIDQAIGGLIPAMYHFVIFESEPAIEDCFYMQTLILDEGERKGQYMVEARYIFAESFRHYRKFMKDAAEVKKLFRAFAEGSPPNVAGWEDVTDKIIVPAG